MLGVAAALSLTGMWWYRRPIRAARRIGVDWRATVDRSRCNTTWRELFCTTIRNVPPIPARYVTLQINPITRSVHRIERAIQGSDSIAWHRFVDSAYAALSSSGGTPIPCYNTETNFPIAEAWRVGDTETRLFAAWLPANHAGHPDALGYAGVLVVPFDAPGCGRSFQYHLLSPAEIAHRVDVWFSERVGF